MKRFKQKFLCGASTLNSSDKLIKARAVAVFLDGSIVCGAVVVSTQDIAIPRKCLNCSHQELDSYEARMLHPVIKGELITYKLDRIVADTGVYRSIRIIRVSSTTENSRYHYTGE